MVCYRYLLPMIVFFSLLYGGDYSWEQSILNGLSIEEKIGQLFVIAVPAQERENLELASIISRHRVGGVIFQGNGDPEDQLHAIHYYNHYAALPLLVCQDSEWGLAMRLSKNPHKVVQYPKAMTLGAIENEKLVYNIGYEIGNQCHAVGVHMNLAPVVDVNNNSLNPIIHQRAFGDNPERVALLATLYAKGMRDTGILTCAKHFPGHGNTTVDSHVALPMITASRADLECVELYPFGEAIRHNSDAIMVGHLAVPALDNTGTPASLSPVIINQFLRKHLQFDGLIITDGLDMAAIATKDRERGIVACKAFLAGNDILLCPQHVSEAIQKIKQVLYDGTISYKDLDARVLRVLHAKKRAFAARAQHTIADPLSFIIRDEAYALQKKAYAAAIALIYNTMPVSIFTDQNMRKSTLIQLGSLPNDVFVNKSKSFVAHAVVYPTVTLESVDACVHASMQSALVTVLLGSMHTRAKEDFGITDMVKQCLHALKNAGKLVQIFIFGTPYSVAHIPKVDTALLVHEDLPIAQEVAADVFLGVAQAEGKMPIQWCAMH